MFWYGEPSIMLPGHWPPYWCLESWPRHCLLYLDSSGIPELPQNNSQALILLTFRLFCCFLQSKYFRQLFFLLKTHKPMEVFYQLRVCNTIDNELGYFLLTLIESVLSLRFVDNNLNGLDLDGWQGCVKSCQDYDWVRHVRYWRYNYRIWSCSGIVTIMLATPTHHHCCVTWTI